MALETSLTNLQQELLKIYSTDLEEADLLNIKKMLANYFAEKAIKSADDI